MKFSLHNHHRPHHQHLNSSINISRNIINIIIVLNIIYIIMIISIISVLLMLLMIVIIMPMLASPGISTRTLAMTPSSRLSRLFARRGERGAEGGEAFFYLASPYSGLVHAPNPFQAHLSPHTACSSFACSGLASSSSSSSSSSTAAASSCRVLPDFD